MGKVGSYLNFIQLSGYLNCKIEENNTHKPRILFSYTAQNHTRLPHWPYAAWQDHRSNSADQRSNVPMCNHSRIRKLVCYPIWDSYSHRSLQVWIMNHNQISDQRRTQKPQRRNVNEGNGKPWGFILGILLSASGILRNLCFASSNSWRIFAISSSAVQHSGTAMAHFSARLASAGSVEVIVPNPRKPLRNPEISSFSDVKRSKFPQVRYRRKHL